MAESELDSATEKSNGVFLEVVEDSSYHSKSSRNNKQDFTLFDVLRRLISQIFFPNPNTSYATTTTTLFYRIKSSVSENVPLLREASRNTSRDVLFWTRRGTPLRPLLVVSVGTTTLLALTGFLVFMLFFLVATLNATVISFLVSSAAAGGFLALFFVGMTFIYIGALLVASFAVSIATISAIITALVVSGWIGFSLTAWMLTKRSVDIAISIL